MVVDGTRGCRIRIRSRKPSKTVIDARERHVTDLHKTMLFAGSSLKKVDEILDREGPRNVVRDAPNFMY